MTDKVVDASALAAVLFDERDRAEAEARLKDARLFAPSLLDFEMASVCLKKIRARPPERSALLSLFDDYLALPIVRLENDLSETITLATDSKLSLYDAAYLWLARNMDVELVTLDAKLARAARR